MISPVSVGRGEAAGVPGELDAAVVLPGPAVSHHPHGRHPLL